jgi:hypothetical protein
MHVFSNVLTYLMKGKISVLDDEKIININFEIFKYLKADDFPELEFFKKHGNVHKPLQMITLFPLHLAVKINVERDSILLNTNITLAEIEQTLKFIELFEDMYQLYVFDKEEFGPKHYEKMVVYQNYVRTLTFSGEFNAREVNLLGTKTTEEALKMYMFTGPKDLYERGIKFGLSNLNQWELEQIYENIKIINLGEPTKKDFVCSINKILNYPYTDFSKHRFSQEKMIKNPVLPSSDIVIEENHNFWIPQTNATEFEI